jgi:hypothetical protein
VTVLLMLTTGLMMLVMIMVLDPTRETCARPAALRQRKEMTLTCAARKYDSCCDLGYYGRPTGGAGVFVDQAAQDGFPDNPCAAEVGNGGMAAVRFTAGGALGDALARPGSVAVHLVLG